MSNGDLNWIVNFIWGIADDVLRDLYVRGKYRDVILPMTVLRRLDAVLEPTKQAVLDMKATVDKADITNQDQALRQATGQSFYNTSKFTLRDLRARASQQQLKPVLDQVASLEATLAPYEQIKRDLAKARARFRELTDAFVSELKNRCGFMGDDKKRTLVLELFVPDVQGGLDGAVSEKRQALVRFIEGLWDKYRVTLTDLRCERHRVEKQLEQFIETLSYR